MIGQMQHQQTGGALWDFAGTGARDDRNPSGDNPVPRTHSIKRWRGSLPRAAQPELMAMVRRVCSILVERIVRHSENAPGEISFR